MRICSPEVSMDPGLLMNQPASPQHPSGMLNQSCSENNLNFTCELKTGPGQQLLSVEEDDNVSIDCESVSVILPAQCTVYQLRLRICMQVGKPSMDGLLFKSMIKMNFLSEGFCAFPLIFTSIVGPCN